MECQKQAKQREYSDQLNQGKKQKHQEKMGNEEGDQEKFKKIIWGSKTYEISNFGRVKRLSSKYRKKEIFLKPSRGRYLRVTFFCFGMRKTFSVHRLVAISFIENKMNKQFINHKDGNRYNNYYGNLEWCTPKENVDHSIKVLGVKRNSEKQRASARIVGKLKRKLSFDHAEQIRKSKLSRKVLSKTFKVSLSVIDKIINNNTYRTPS